MIHDPILVCEGRCSNGTVQSYDALVQEATLPDGKVVMTGAMRGLRKQWVYTKHFGNGDAHKFYRCTECAHLRRFGAPLV